MEFTEAASIIAQRVGNNNISESFWQAAVHALRADLRGAIGEERSVVDVGIFIIP